MPEAQEVETSPLDTEDFAAYEAAMDADENPAEPVEEEEAIPSEAPATEEVTPPAESAEESETSPKEEQEEKPEPGKPGQGVQKRIDKLTKEKRELEARLAALEAEPETPEPAAPQSVEKPDAKTKTPRPKLGDFEDYSAYEAADEKWVEDRIEARAAELEATRKAEETQRQAVAQVAKQEAEWAAAAAELPDDYNDVVGAEDNQISLAMEVVMKHLVPAKTGTKLAYHLGQHPEEAKRIMDMTLAPDNPNDPRVHQAIARAAFELGTLNTALLKADEKKAPPAPKPQPKQVTSAPKPPTKVAGARSAPPPDLYDPNLSFEDHERIMNARENKR